MVWCDDVKSKYYNKLIKKNKKVSYENLYKKGNNYDFLIPINYNTSPIKKNKGSAIFLHLAKKSLSPTNGCLAIKKGDLLKILPLIDKKTKLFIY